VSFILCFFKDNFIYQIALSILLFRCVDEYQEACHISDL
jgi:hypothetical protein